MIVVLFDLVYSSTVVKALLSRVAVWRAGHSRQSSPDKEDHQDRRQASMGAYYGVLLEVPRHHY